MPRRNYSTHQLCLLALSSIPGISPATINALTKTARTSDTSLRDFLELDARTLTSRLSVSPAQAKRVVSVSNPLAQAQDTVEFLETIRTYPLFRNQMDYPDALSEHLGEKAPPVLFIAGDPTVLTAPTVAVVGSRRPSNTTRKAAFQFAMAQADSGVTVVSGGARGIDTAGHQGAIRNGSTALVPPTGISRHRWKGIDRNLLQPGHWCVVGQFPPRDPWRTRNALRRNHTIVALSDAVIGFEPRDEGGTWRSCRSALRMRKPLFIVNGSDKADRRRGQRYFVNHGAVALNVDQMPDPEEFRQLVDDYSPPPVNLQSDLFD